MADYDLDSHAHQFAMWTAARAVQQPGGHGLSSETVKNVIERTGLRGKIEGLEKPSLTHKDFGEWHKAFIPKMQGEVEKAKWGVLAKIVAIYLKTYWVLRKPNSRLAHVAFPPLDSILLKNLEKEGIKNANETTWTQLDETTYYPLIDRLRDFIGDEPFWKIEVYWKK